MVHRVQSSRRCRHRLRPRVTGRPRALRADQAVGFRDRRPSGRAECRRAWFGATSARSFRALSSHGPARAGGPPSRPPRQPGGPRAEQFARRTARAAAKRIRRPIACDGREPQRSVAETLSDQHQVRVPRDRCRRRSPFIGCGMTALSNRPPPGVRPIRTGPSPRPDDDHSDPDGRNNGGRRHPRVRSRPAGHHPATGLPTCFENSTMERDSAP